MVPLYRTEPFANRYQTAGTYTSVVGGQFSVEKNGLFALNTTKGRRIGWLLMTGGQKSSFVQHTKAQPIQHDLSLTDWAFSSCR
jgi:hypothetical protein